MTKLRLGLEMRQVRSSAQVAERHATMPIGHGRWTASVDHQRFEASSNETRRTCTYATRPREIDGERQLEGDEPLRDDGRSGIDSSALVKL
jgi:hypothetical protein